MNDDINYDDLGQSAINKHVSDLSNNGMADIAKFLQWLDSEISVNDEGQVTYMPYQEFSEERFVSEKQGFELAAAFLYGVFYEQKEPCKLFREGLSDKELKRLQK